MSGYKVRQTDREYVHRREELNSDGDEVRGRRGR